MKFHIQKGFFVSFFQISMLFNIETILKITFKSILEKKNILWNKNIFTWNFALLKK